MKDILALLLVPLLLAGPPVCAQSLCLECIKAAEKELKTCIENAISVEDKNSCEEKRKEQLKTGEDSECKVERENRETRSDVPSQGR